MRLTLRTMLAYMDNILRPEDAQEMKQRIEASERAEALMARVQNCLHKRGRGEPLPLEGQGLATDANSVAEYLDNTLPAEEVPEFEKICLDDDVHLAEVAACHQVLAQALDKKSHIPAALRQRIHKLAQPGGAGRSAAASGGVGRSGGPAGIGGASLGSAATVEGPDAGRMGTGLGRGPAGPAEAPGNVLPRPHYAGDTAARGGAPSAAGPGTAPTLVRSDRAWRTDDPLPLPTGTTSGKSAVRSFAFAALITFLLASAAVIAFVPVNKLPWLALGGKAADTANRDGAGDGEFDESDLTPSEVKLDNAGPATDGSAAPTDETDADSSVPALEPPDHLAVELPTPSAQLSPDFALTPPAEGEAEGSATDVAADADTSTGAANGSSELVAESGEVPADVAPPAAPSAAASSAPVFDPPALASDTAPLASDTPAAPLDFQPPADAEVAAPLLDHPNADVSSAAGQPSATDLATSDRAVPDVSSTSADPNSVAPELTGAEPAPAEPTSSSAGSSGIVDPLTVDRSREDAIGALEVPDAARIEAASPPALPAESGPWQVADFDANNPLSRFVLIQSMDGVWSRLAPQMTATHEAQLLSLPVFRPQLQLEQFQIQLVGATRATLAQGGSDGMPTLGMTYGSALVSVKELAASADDEKMPASAGDDADSESAADEDEGALAGEDGAGAGAQLVLKWGDRLGVLTLLTPDTQVAIELTPLRIPGTDPLQVAPNQVLEVTTLNGSAIWQSKDSSEPLALAVKDQVQVVDQHASKLVKVANVPSWTDAKQVQPTHRLPVANLQQLALPRQIDLDAAKQLEASLAVNSDPQVALLRFADHRRAENRALAYRALVHMGQFDPIVTACNNSNDRAAWPLFVAELSAALARGPETAEALQASLQRVYPQHASDLFRILIGYDPEQLAKGGAELLVNELENIELVRRVFAFETLKDITMGKSFGYQPEDISGRRAKAPMRSWRDHLTKGKIAYTTENQPRIIALLKNFELQTAE